MADLLTPISRSGEHLGSWTGVEIRRRIASGELRTTDAYFDYVDEVSLLLLPPPKAPVPVFDWNGEGDHLWYYIQDGFMHGPRRGEELDALHAAGYLRGDSLLSLIGSEMWFTFDEAVPPKAAVAPDVGREHLQAGRELLMNGNLLGAAVNLGLGAFLSSGGGHTETNSAPPDGAPPTK